MDAIAIRTKVIKLKVTNINDRTLQDATEEEWKMKGWECVDRLYPIDGLADIEALIFEKRIPAKRQVAAMLVWIKDNSVDGCVACGGTVVCFKNCPVDAFLEVFDGEKD